MKYLCTTFYVMASLGVAALLLQAYEYSFGTGYGLHPALAGAGIGILAVCWVTIDKIMGEVDVEGGTGRDHFR